MSQIFLTLIISFLIIDDFFAQLRQLSARLVEVFAENLPVINFDY